MKFSAALALSIAPLALAKSVHNVYPGRRNNLEVRSNESKDTKSNNNNNSKDSKGNSNSNNAALDAFLLGQQLGAAQAATLLQQVIIIWVNNGGGQQTTTVNSQVTVTRTQTVTAGGAAGATNVAAGTTAAAEAGTQTVVSGASTTVAATGATHTVTVGGPGGLAFQPDQIAAAIGDMVVFTFLSQNHTATQSAFNVPCEALAGGMDSGFRANPNNSMNPPPQVAMQVMVSTPLCKQTPPSWPAACRLQQLTVRVCF
jgi:plastocyanin